MRPSGNKIDDMKTDLVSAHTSIMASVNNFTSAVIRIRDILRKTAISGMESMRHICLYLMARQITRQTVLDLDVPIKFAWENIIEMMHTQEGGEQYALEYFYHPEEDCLVRHFDRLFGTEKFSFDIKNLKTHKEILEILDRIDLSMVDSQMDILGWVYEQHLKTGAGSGGRDLGQFFTDRTICEYMVSLCRPAFKRAGVPESVCDPSMGTGGFLTSFIKYYKKNHSDTPINWKIQQKEIHGCDNDPRVAGIARMNLFMETGGSRPTNLRTHDSLHGDLTQTGYDVILANEPFGLKGLKHADCCERVKQLKIRGTKSEPLFLQLMMVSLNHGGRCAVVVPDGMLVNTSELHDGTRKYLLDHFELKRVIKMRGQFFMNTGIQPSILFFENTGNPTTAVEFWDVIKSANGPIEETMVLSVPRDKLDASCSLDMRRYQEVKEVANLAGYPMVKLGDIAFSKKYPSHDTSVGKESGSSKFHTGGEYTRLYTDDPDIYDTIIIVNRTNGSGKSNIFIDSVCSVAKQTLVMSCDNVVTTTYLFYWLSLNKQEIEKGYIGSNHKNLSSDFVKNMVVPLPPLAIQQEIISTLDRIYHPGTTELAETLKLTNQAMDLVLAQPNGATLEPIMEAQRLMRKSAQMVTDVKAQMVTDVKAQMVAIVKSVGSRGFSVKKLAEACDISKGKRCLEAVTDGGYPYQDVSKISRMVANYILHTPAVLTPRAMSIGRFVYVDEKCHPSDDMFILKPKDGLNTKYLYYYCTLLLSTHFKESFHGIKPTIDYSVFDYTNITIPPLDFQQTVLARLDALQSQLTSLENLGKQAEDNARFILESYLQSHTESPYSSEAVWNSHEETLVNEVVEESSSAAASSAISAPRPLKMKKPAVSKK
jgi:restriction endonuclease S subunit